MLASQKLAIAAHLHVLLRRKTGRVTDTEWMAGNLEYALEIIRFTRAKAKEDGHPDLLEWADKLERAVLEPTPAMKRPLAQTALQLLKERNLPEPRATAPPAAALPQAAPPPGPPSGFGHSLFGESAPEVVAPGPRYVGGLR